MKTSIILFVCFENVESQKVSNVSFNWTQHLESSSLATFRQKKEKKIESSHAKNKEKKLNYYTGIKEIFYVLKTVRPRSYVL
jgi:hypothetical protein